VGTVETAFPTPFQEVPRRIPAEEVVQREVLQEAAPEALAVAVLEMETGRVETQRIMGVVVEVPETDQARDLREVTGTRE
jgi:hypothetical protein